MARNWALGFTQQAHILARPMAATDIEDKLFSDMIKSNEIRSSVGTKTTIFSLKILKLNKILLIINHRNLTRNKLSHFQLLLMQP